VASALRRRRGGQAPEAKRGRARQRFLAGRQLPPSPAAPSRPRFSPPSSDSPIARSAEHAGRRRRAGLRESDILLRPSAIAWRTGSLAFGPPGGWASPRASAPPAPDRPGRSGKIRSIACEWPISAKAIGAENRSRGHGRSLPARILQMSHPSATTRQYRPKRQSSMPARHRAKPSTAADHRALTSASVGPIGAKSCCAPTDLALPSLRRSPFGDRLNQSAPAQKMPARLPGRQLPRRPFLSAAKARNRVMSFRCGVRHRRRFFAACGPLWMERW